MTSIFKIYSHIRFMPEDNGLKKCVYADDECDLRGDSIPLCAMRNETLGYSCYRMNDDGTIKKKYLAKER